MCFVKEFIINRRLATLLEGAGYLFFHDSSANLKKLFIEVLVCEVGKEVVQDSAHIRLVIEIRILSSGR